MIGSLALMFVLSLGCAMTPQPTQQQTTDKLFATPEWAQIIEFIRF
jgi:hypothetical protein